MDPGNLICEATRTYAACDAAETQPPPSQAYSGVEYTASRNCNLSLSSSVDEASQQGGRAYSGESHPKTYTIPVNKIKSFLLPTHDRKHSHVLTCGTISQEHSLFCLDCVQDIFSSSSAKHDKYRSYKNKNLEYDQSLHPTNTEGSIISLTYFDRILPRLDIIAQLRRLQSCFMVFQNEAEWLRSFCRTFFWSSPVEQFDDYYYSQLAAFLVTLVSENPCLTISDLLNPISNPIAGETKDTVRVLLTTSQLFLLRHMLQNTKEWLLEVKSHIFCTYSISGLWNCLPDCLLGQRLSSKYFSNLPEQSKSAPLVRVEFSNAISSKVNEDSCNRIVPEAFIILEFLHYLFVRETSPGAQTLSLDLRLALRNAGSNLCFILLQSPQNEKTVQCCIDLMHFFLEILTKTRENMELEMTPCHEQLKSRTSEPPENVNAGAPECLNESNLIMLESNGKWLLNLLQNYFVDLPKLVEMFCLTLLASKLEIRRGALILLYRTWSIAVDAFESQSRKNPENSCMVSSIKWYHDLKKTLCHGALGDYLLESLRLVPSLTKWGCNLDAQTYVSHTWCYTLNSIIAYHPEAFCSYYGMKTVVLKAANSMRDGLQHSFSANYVPVFRTLIDIFSLHRVIPDSATGVQFSLPQSTCPLEASVSHLLPEVVQLMKPLVEHGIISGHGSEFFISVFELLHAILYCVQKQDEAELFSQILTRFLESATYDFKSITEKNEMQAISLHKYEIITFLLHDCITHPCMYAFLEHCLLCKAFSIILNVFLNFGKFWSVCKEGFLSSILRLISWHIMPRARGQKLTCVWPSDDYYLKMDTFCSKIQNTPGVHSMILKSLLDLPGCAIPSPHCGICEDNACGKNFLQQLIVEILIFCKFILPCDADQYLCLLCSLPSKGGDIMLLLKAHSISPKTQYLILCLLYEIMCVDSSPFCRSQAILETNLPWGLEHKLLFRVLVQLMEDRHESLENGSFFLLSSCILIFRDLGSDESFHIPLIDVQLVRQIIARRLYSVNYERKARSRESFSVIDTGVPSHPPRFFVAWMARMSEEHTSFVPAVFQAFVEFSILHSNLVMSFQGAFHLLFRRVSHSTNSEPWLINQTESAPCMNNSKYEHAHFILLLWKSLTTQWRMTQSLIDETLGFDNLCCQMLCSITLVLELLLLQQIHDTQYFIELTKVVHKYFISHGPRIPRCALQHLFCVQCLLMHLEQTTVERASVSDAYDTSLTKALCSILLEKSETLTAKKETNLDGSTMGFKSFDVTLKMCNFCLRNQTQSYHLQDSTILLSCLCLLFLRPRFRDCIKIFFSLANVPFNSEVIHRNCDSSSCILLFGRIQLRDASILYSAGDLVLALRHRGILFTDERVGVTINDVIGLCFPSLQVAKTFQYPDFVREKWLQVLTVSIFDANFVSLCKDEYLTHPKHSCQLPQHMWRSLSGSFIETLTACLYQSYPLCISYVCFMRSWLQAFHGALIEHAALCFIFKLILSEWDSTLLRNSPTDSDFGKMLKHDSELSDVESYSVTGCQMFFIWICLKHRPRWMTPQLRKKTIFSVSRIIDWLANSYTPIHCSTDPANGPCNLCDIIHIVSYFIVTSCQLLLELICQSHNLDELDTKCQKEVCDKAIHSVSDLLEKLKHSSYLNDENKTVTVKHKDETTKHFIYLQQYSVDLLGYYDLCEIWRDLDPWMWAKYRSKDAIRFSSLLLQQLNVLSSDQYNN